MATLTPLVPIGDSSVFPYVLYNRGASAWTETATAASYTHINQTVGSIANGDTGIGLPLSHNAVSVVARFLFSNTPADFVSMDTLSVHYDAEGVGYSDDTGSLSVVIWHSTLGNLTSTVTIQSFNGSVYSRTNPVQNQTVAFSITPAGTTATKAQWDAAYLYFTATDIKNKGSDSASIVLADIRLTGTYTGGGSTTPKTVAATSTMTPALSRTKTAVRTLAATSTMTPIISRVRTAVRTLAATSTMTAAYLKNIGKTIAASSVMTPVLDKGLLVTQAIDAVSTMVANIALTRTYQRTLAATSTMAAAVVKVVGKTLAVGSTLVPTMNRAVTLLRTLAVNSTHIPTLNRVVSYPRTLAASSAMTPVLVAAKTFSRALDAVSTMTASMLKTVGKTLAVSSTLTPVIDGTTTFVRTLAASSTMVADRVLKILKTLEVSSVMTPVLSASQLILKNIAAASTMVASLTPKQVLGVLLEATSTMVPTLTRVATFAQNLSVGSAMTVGLDRLIKKTLAASTTLTASMVRGMFVTLDAVSSLVPSLQEIAAFPRTIAASVSNVANLVTNFIPGGPGPVLTKLFSRAVASTGRVLKVPKDT